MAVALGLVVWAHPVLALISCIGLVGVILALVAPTLGLALLVPMLAFNGLATQVLGTGSLSASAFGSLKDGLLLLLAIHALGRRSELPTALVLVVYFYVAVGVVSLAWSSSLTAGLYGLRTDFEPVLAFLIFERIIDRQQAARLLRLVIGVGVAGSLVAIYTKLALQLSWIYRLRILPAQPFPTAYFVSGSVLPRAFSPYVGPNELGVSLVLVLAVVTTRGWRLSRTLAVASPLCFALILTRSRSAAIGGVLLLAFLGWLRQSAKRESFQRRMVVLAVVGTAVAVSSVVALSFFGSELKDPSARGHAASIQVALARVVSHPLPLGVGEVGPRSERYSQHPVLVESYLLVLGLEAGWAGLLLYVAVLVRLYRLAIKKVNAHHVEVQAWLGAAVLLCVLPSELSLPVFQDSSVSWLFWLVFACSLKSGSGLGGNDHGGGPTIKQRVTGSRQVAAHGIQVELLASGPRPNFDLPS